MHKWSSFRQKSIGCTSQNKLLQRETTTTKQHSYRLYHAQKPTLAPDTLKKHDKWLVLVGSKNLIELISSCTSFNCTRSCIERGFGFRQQANTSGCVFRTRQHRQLNHVASFILRNTCGCPAFSAHVSDVLAWHGGLPNGRSYHTVSLLLPSC